jgi:transposase
MLHKSIITTGKEIINNGKEFISKIIEKIELKTKKDEHTKEKYVKEFDISNRQFKILKNLIKSVKTRTDVKKRAQIIFKYYFDNNISRCSRELGISRNTIRKWKKKWIRKQSLLLRTEIEEPHKLKSTVIMILSDDYRTGRPSRIKSEQVAAIIYLSLQEPNLFGLPISHWTAEKLREIAIKLGIVEKVSTRQISRYLKQTDINIYKYEEWLNSIESNPDFEEYMERVKRVCEIYVKSEEYEEKGIVVLSTDEKTGIQAIEHKHPVKPMKIGSCKKVEQEYIRNGKTTLIASRDINTGKIIPMLNPTRTEEDFVVHIKEVLKVFDGAKEVILIMDQLNTHMSESLVKLVAQECNIDVELGVKGIKGILKSMKTRAKFLEDSSHRIRIVYTPKHCSWLNQIELWFGIITKQLLNRRSSFKSVDELNKKIEEYIEYYNENLAKKFKWNYSGKVLQV